MKRMAKGFGLIEIMVALVLGVVVSMGIVQIFTASRGTYQTQGTSARMQEDARFVLSKLLQEIRMTGMYGCLSLDNITPVAGAIAKPVAFNTPINWDNSSNTLTLITADVGTAGGSPTWTVVSDCRSGTQIYAGTGVVATGQTTFPLRQLTYVRTGTDMTLRQGTASAQGLLSNIRAFSVSFGMAGSPMSYTTAISAGNAADIRSVRISLTLFDPEGKVKDQSYNVVAAVRNRF